MVRPSHGPEFEERKSNISRLTELYEPVMAKRFSDERFVQKLAFDHKDIQLVFPLHNFFMLGSPLAMFVSCYFQEDYIRS